MKTFNIKSVLVIFYSICILLFMNIACTKIIQVDIKDSNSRIVIEANVSTEDKEHFIKISRSKKLDDVKEPQLITSAFVTMDIYNKENIFIETKVFDYTSSSQAYIAKLKGEVGYKYNLKVECEGQVYEASSIIPDSIVLENIKFEKISFSNFSPEQKPRYLTIPIFSAKKIQPNDKIKFIKHIKNLTDKELYIRKFVQGLTSVQPIGTTDKIEDETNDGRINYIETQSGDLMTLEVQSLTTEAYNYFYSLSAVIKDEVSTPSNPPTNFSNHPVGYFNAYSVTKIYVKLP